MPLWQFYFCPLRNTEQTKDKSPHLNTETITSCEEFPVTQELKGLLSYEFLGLGI